MVLLRHIGFHSVAISSFREDVDPASELRRSGVVLRRSDQVTMQTSESEERQSASFLSP